MRRSSLESVRYAADRADDQVKFTDEACEQLLNVPRVFLPTVLRGCVDWARENGVTLVTADGAETEFAVTGGFVEINNESVSLLAERGHPRAEMTQDVFNDMMMQAQRRVKVARDKDSAAEEVVAAAVKLLADMEALGTHIGLDPKQANFPD